MEECLPGGSSQDCQLLPVPGDWGRPGALLYSIQWRASQPYRPIFLFEYQGCTCRDMCVVTSFTCTCVKVRITKQIILSYMSPMLAISQSHDTLLEDPWGRVSSFMFKLDCLKANMRKPALGFLGCYNSRTSTWGGGRAYRLTRLQAGDWWQELGKLSWQVQF